MSASFLLITPASNEEKFIQHSLDAVVSQKLKPICWAIVSDNSTDGTDRIVQSYVEKYPFIRLLRRERAGGRNFSSKAGAVNMGMDAVEGIDTDYIVFMDADCSFGPEFFAAMMGKFAADERLGVAGGWVFDIINGETSTVRNYIHDVSGAVQAFRRACIEDIGGYVEGLPGGEDTVATIMARMKGWRTRSFEDLPVYHHRRTGAGEGGILRARFRNGMRERLVGYHPLYFAGKCVWRIMEPPFVIGSVLRLAGYLWGAIRTVGKPGLLPRDIVDHLRREQRERIMSISRGPWA